MVVHRSSPCLDVSPLFGGKGAMALGGALSAVRAQCNYLGVCPYCRPILLDTRGP